MFGPKLKGLREKKGLTQAQVAGVLGCSTPRISEWERNVRTPKPLTQEAIIARLDSTKGPGPINKKSGGVTKKKSKKKK